jgi:hypothetical protein
MSKYAAGYANNYIATGQFNFYKGRLSSKKYVLHLYLAFVDLFDIAHYCFMFVFQVAANLIVFFGLI